MTIYVWYDATRGWLLIDQHEFHRLRCAVGAWCCKYIHLDDKSPVIRIVVTGGIHPRAVATIGERACGWLLESGYIVKRRGGIRRVGVA